MCEVSRHRCLRWVCHNFFIHSSYFFTEARRFSATPLMSTSVLGHPTLPLLFFSNWDDGLTFGDSDFKCRLSTVLNKTWTEKRKHWHWNTFWHLKMFRWKIKKTFSGTFLPVCIYFSSGSIFNCQRLKSLCLLHRLLRKLFFIEWCLYLSAS